MSSRVSRVGHCNLERGEQQYRHTGQQNHKTGVLVLFISIAKQMVCVDDKKVSKQQERDLFRIAVPVLPLGSNPEKDLRPGRGKRQQNVDPCGNPQENRFFQTMSVNRSGNGADEHEKKKIRGTLGCKMEGTDQVPEPRRIGGT